MTLVQHCQLVVGICRQVQMVMFFYEYDKSIRDKVKKDSFKLILFVDSLPNARKVPMHSTYIKVISCEH